MRACKARANSAMNWQLSWGPVTGPGPVTEPESVTGPGPVSGPGPGPVTVNRHWLRSWTRFLNGDCDSRSPLCGLCLPGGALFLPPGVGTIPSRLAGGMKTAPGWGMHNPQSSSVLEHALAVVVLSRPIVEAVQRRDRDLASQLRRALSSIALNLSEGYATVAGNARLR